MRILGIDPGLATMGFGIVDAERGQLTPVHFGVLTTPPDMPFQTRLLTLEDGMNALLNAYRPEEIVFEELFFARNVTTAMTVGAARGVAVAAAARYTERLFEYTPMQIKQAIVGYGKADKHQMQHMMKLLLKLEDIPRPDDAADALAAAVTHANTGKMASQFRMK